MTRPSFSIISSIAGLTFVIAIASFLYTARRRGTANSHVRRPPTPRSDNFLGASYELIQKELWLRVKQWAAEYGDVLYFSVFGKPIVFLNTLEAASDLLDTRGKIYSDRPRMVMAGELCGFGDSVAFLSYGEPFRRQRKLFSRALNPQHIPSYRPLIWDSTKDVLKLLLETPANYSSHFRRYAGGLTLQVVYGHRPASSSDELLKLAEESVGLLANKIAPSGSVWLVDVIPALKNIPSWLPGASFKRKAAIWRPILQESVDKPFELTKNNMKEGTATACFCTMLLSDVPKSANTAQLEHDLKWGANSMYGASIDSTIGSMSHFVLAMMLNPAILKRAQEEIDAVVGRDRLPNFVDRSSLPYVEAVVVETLRWAAPVPLGLPHCLSADDVYKNMHIPRGSLVFANNYAMLRNEKLYPNAESFDPSRFLDVSPERFAELDPRKAVFGFGRRVCPGQYLVDSSLWLLIACMIASFDIRDAQDEHGRPIEPVIRYENSVFRTPSSFACKISPRSDKSVSLIYESQLSPM